MVSRASYIPELLVFRGEEIVYSGLVFILFYFSSSRLSGLLFSKTSKKKRRKNNDSPKKCPIATKRGTLLDGK